MAFWGNLYRGVSEVFKLREIRELIHMVDNSGINELEIETEGFRVMIKKSARGEPTATQAPMAVLPHSSVPIQSSPSQTVPQPSATPDEEPEKKDGDLHAIVAPMVGTFYQAPAPDAPPYVKKGDKVTENTVVCIIEAMKLMNEIEAEVRGEIVDILVENGQLVEYGQPLFLVKPE